MTLEGPIALRTLATVAAVLGGLTVIAYILKLRRRRHEVPFTKLWQRVLREKDATSLWRKLKRLLSLLVQLVFLALLLGAALDPRIGHDPHERNARVDRVGDPRRDEREPDRREVRRDRDLALEVAAHRARQPRLRTVQPDDRRLQDRVGDRGQPNRFGLTPS